MADHYYNPVGQCIYCGTTKLLPDIDRFTDEHIIPLGLGGDLILQEASCIKCLKIINKQIETPILRHEWGAFRDKYGLPTRNKKDRATRVHLPVTGIDGSQLFVPLRIHSTPVPLYRFDEPRILSKKTLPTLDHHWTMSLLADHEQEMAMQRNFPRWNRRHRFMTRPHLFARMLSKIAYGYAVAEYGKSTLGTFMPLAPDVIRGFVGDWTQTVGGSLEIPPAIPGSNHITEISIIGTGTNFAYLVVDIRLFPQNSTPTYRVVVGRIDFKNPEHIRAFEQHRLDGKLMH